MLAELLAGSKQSPLYESIVIDKKLAPGVAVFSRARELAGELIVRVRGLEGVALDDVQSALEDGLQRFDQAGFDDAELRRIKVELEVGFYQGVSSVLSKARLLANYNEIGGDPGLIGEEIRRLQAVTREDVMRVFHKYVRGQHYVQTSFVPKEAPELAVAGSVLATVIEESVIQGSESAVSQGDIADYEKTPSRYDRSEPPYGELPVFRSPEVWSGALHNGIEIVGIEDDEAPLVSFSLLLPGGQWRDKPDQLGAAALVAALATQGTASRTPAELELAIGLLGASISFSVGAETLAIYGVTLERNLEATIALLEEMILEPRWDAEEFVRLRSAARARIVAAEGNAGAVARQTWNSLVYGKEHPFGRAARGTRESLAQLTVEDLRQWYSANVKPQGAKLQVVGSVDRARVLRAFQGLAERWEGEPPPLLDYALAPPLSGGTVYFVDLPSAKQSVIRVGKRVMPVSDPDWIRLNYANERLGRGSSARLMQLLRIEKGYTYGAGSSLGASRYAVSPWFASTSVRANVTLESMKLLREQIRNYDTTFTDSDADVTKNQIVKRKARAYETLRAKLGLLNRIALQGVPYDIVEQEISILQAMSVEDFQQVISDNLLEDDMVWVVVGDAASQLDRIAEFGYGEPTQLSNQGLLLASP